MPVLKNGEIKANRPDIDTKLKEGDVWFVTSRFQMTEILPQNSQRSSKIWK